jgi:HEAT repeat protein
MQMTTNTNLWGGLLMKIATRVALAIVIIFTVVAANTRAESAAAFSEQMLKVNSLFAQAASGGNGLAELKEMVNRKDIDTSVKMHALEKIGELARPEADKFLIQVSADASESVLQHAARLAYLNSRVIREPSQAGKKKILVETMNTEAMRDTRSWAAEELCDMGDTASLPQVRKTISAVDPTPSGNKRFSACESKVRLLSKYSSRIEALKSALSDKDDGIRRWGIQHLGKLKTAEADTTLVNFASELQKNPQDANERLLNLTVHALKERGWDDQRLNARGIENRGGLRMPKRRQGQRK